MTFQELIAEEIGNRAEYESQQAKVWDETVDKAEKMLLEKYGRENASENGAKHADRDYSYDALIKKQPIQVTEFAAQPVPTKRVKRGTVVDTQALAFDLLKGIKAKMIDAGTLRSLTAKTAASRSATKASITLNVSDMLDFVKDEYPEYLTIR